MHVLFHQVRIILYSVVLLADLGCERCGGAGGILRPGSTVWSQHQWRTTRISDSQRIQVSSNDDRSSPDICLSICMPAQFTNTTNNWRWQEVARCAFCELAVLLYFCYWLSSPWFVKYLIDFLWLWRNQPHQVLSIHVDTFTHSSVSEKADVYIFKYYLITMFWKLSNGILNQVKMYS